MQQLLVVDNIPFARQHAAQIVLTVFPKTGALKIFEAKSDRDGLDAFNQLRPELVMLDVSLAGAGGLVLAKRIWEIERKTKILFWAHTHNDAYLGELAKIAPSEGVYGYVLKSEGDEKLRYAIMAVFLHNNQYTDPTVRTSITRPALRSDFLTAAETETLIDIALGLTDRAVASRRGLTVRGVQNRLATLSLKILRKDHWKLRQPADLEVFNPRTRLIMEALRRGYLRIDQLQASELECETWLGLSKMARPTVKTIAAQQQQQAQFASQQQTNIVIENQTNFAVPLPGMPNIQQPVQSGF
jgi:DNA-binding NarL/FixJ family response regulator